MSGPRPPSSMCQSLFTVQLATLEARMVLGLRQLLINLQKFKVKKGIKKAKSSVALHADCFCVCLLKCDWSILVRLEKQATNKKRNASNTIPMQIRLYMLRDSRRIQ